MHPEASYGIKWIMTKIGLPQTRGHKLCEKTLINLKLFNVFIYSIYIHWLKHTQEN